MRDSPPGVVGRPSFFFFSQGRLVIREDPRLSNLKRSLISLSLFKTIQEFFRHLTAGCVAPVIRDLVCFTWNLNCLFERPTTTWSLELSNVIIFFKRGEKTGFFKLSKPFFSFSRVYVFLIFTTVWGLWNVDNKPVASFVTNPRPQKNLF